VSKHRNRKTVCRLCKHRGPMVHVDGALHPTCLRHRMDGSAQALPGDWLEALESKEARCDLYEPIAESRSPR
jgi:hypothetical protein